MSPGVLTYMFTGILIGLAGAVNLYTHSEGNRVIILGVCLILWAGLIPLWPLGVIAWLILENLGGTE